ncbi:hypothetical protein AcW1_003438 [Taiwanofungus camphoratus]|nr:hypothetical protein AcV5_002102 [Antrodia cinnamomea]KAI0941579.1 hypothetical protein AcW1_003438 [Antrodia cinnamomea]KAI0943926.1 hypothetical protein AcV7_001877 [Antrodia cinnamomea]
MSAAHEFDEAWLAGPDGHKFYTRTYKAADVPQAVILFIHGFAEHIARYEHAHRDWADRGFTVFTYDQRGFGRTALDAEHHSKDSAYGKTRFSNQMRDIEWWTRRLKEEQSKLPLFLVGQSMGGQLALAFPTRVESPPSKEAVSMISGVIASSPLLLQTFPASKLLRWVGEKAAFVLPWMPFPAEVHAENLSHDPAVNDAVSKDPLFKERGTLRGLADMLGAGEQLLWNDYRNWPKNLPVLILHGTDDKVTSCTASEEFFNKLDAEDKKLSLYPDAYHELSNEPNGVKEKFIDECISWVQAHLPRPGDAPMSKL